MPPSAEQRFRRSFDHLLTFALRRGVPFADAKELVQGTIVAALDRFDEGKGAYLAYCTTILGNRIKNYWRDRKPTESVDEIDVPDPDFQDRIEREEERARMKKMIDRISMELTPEESAFMKALGTACEEMESRAVSQAARSLGLEPAKGWDVFRRIQRKARALFPAPEAVTSFPIVRPGVADISEFPAPAMPREPQESRGRSGSLGSIGPRRTEMHKSSLSYSPSGETLLDLARWAACEESFLHVMASLTGDQMARLRSLYS